MAEFSTSKSSSTEQHPDSLHLAVATSSRSTRLISLRFGLALTSTRTTLILQSLRISTLIHRLHLALFSKRKDTAHGTTLMASGLDSHLPTSSSSLSVLLPTRPYLQCHDLPVDMNDNDSSPELSPARSDISDPFANEEMGNILSSNDHEELSEESQSQETTDQASDDSDFNVSETTVATRNLVLKPRCTTARSAPVQWLSTGRQHIPAPDFKVPAQPATDQTNVLVHLTFQRDRDGYLFHPPQFALDGQERFILSHSVPFFKDRVRNSGRLGRTEKVPGFSAYMQRSTDAKSLELNVQQLLRSYFLHGSPEYFQFDFEFRVVHGNKEGTAQTFDGQKKSLFDICKDHKDASAISAVITKIEALAGGNSQRTKQWAVAPEIIWTHWVRVGNENEFVDRFSASVASPLNNNGPDRLNPPFSSERAVLFGTFLT